MNNRDLNNVEIVNLVKASDETPEPITWLWEGWLAAGKMHILGGQPGTGKTTICLSLAAILSSGGIWPDGTQAESSNVVIWSGEDNIKDTLLPRLMASDADCNRVHFVNGILTGKEKRMFDPASDIEPLHRKLEEIGNVRLLIIDPIVSAVQGDSHKNAEVRRGLQPLVELAESLGCALLGVTHFSKNTGKRDPVERLTGSLAFGALARIVLVVIKKKSGEHIFCRPKTNICPDSGGFKYDMQQSALKEYPEIVASSIQWGEAVYGTAEELLADSEDGTEEEGGMLQEAKDYLLNTLSDGERTAIEIYSDTSISKSSIKRAKKELHVKSVKKGKYWYWYWSLSEQECQADSRVP